MSKPHLILLHGALGNAAQVDALRPFLELEFEVHLFDFSGHGANASTQPYSIDSFAKQTEAFLKDRHIESAHFFGYSMGGYVALNLASKRPEFVRSIFTLGTKFNWTEEAAAKEVRMLNPEKIEEKVPAFAQHLQKVHSANNWKSVVNRTASMMMELGAGDKLTEDELGSISAKVTIAVGSEDNMVSSEESEWAANEIPEASFQVIEGFYHPFEKNEPDLLSRLILNQVRISDS